MRIARDQEFAGLPAETARKLARLYMDVEYSAAVGAEHLEVDETDMLAALRTLTSEGYFLTTTNRDGEEAFITTVKGNALAQASFSKPIKRSTADRQLQGVLERVEEYNADFSKLLAVDELYVFGSYLDPSISELGDLDLSIRILRRYAYEQYNELRQQQVRESGRTFKSFMDELFWPQRNLISTLKARTATIKITGEDVSLLTDRYKLVYSLASDVRAVPPGPEAHRVEL